MVIFVLISSVSSDVLYLYKIHVRYILIKKTEEDLTPLNNRDVQLQVDFSVYRLRS